jgi:hypothetical protein
MSSWTGIPTLSFWFTSHSLKALAIADNGQKGSGDEEHAWRVRRMKGATGAARSLEGPGASVCERLLIADYCLTWLAVAFSVIREHPASLSLFRRATVIRPKKSRMGTR